MKKKVISIILVLTIILPMLQPICWAVEEMQVESDKGIETVAGETLTDGDYQYRVDNNEVTITKYIGTSATIVIPNVINGYSVTSIGYNAFWNCTNLTNINITIPDSVTNIDSSVMSQLADHYKNNSIESINVSNDNPNYSSENGVLFDKNKTILIQYPNGKQDETFEIPSSVTRIAEGAFRHSTNLTSINIPNNVTRIEDYAFSDCSSLTNITISEGVTDLWNYVFSGCSSLQSITIPKSITTMSIGVFDACENLKNINVDTDNSNYSSENGVLFNKDKTTIIKYPEGKQDKSYAIPDGVTSAATYTFKNCTNLVSIIIPSSMITIEGSTFSSCTSLTNVEISEGVESLGSNAFYDCIQLANVEIPKSVTSISGDTFMYCKKLQNINVNKDNPNYSSENGVLFNKDKTAIIKYPEGKPDESYVVPNTVTNIERDSFESIGNLTSIIMLDNIKSIYRTGFCNSRLTIYGIEGSYVHTYANQNNINFKIFNEGKCQKMLDVLPNEIQVDLKESEYEKVGDTIEQKAKEIWQQQGIDTTGMDFQFTGPYIPIDIVRVDIAYNANEGTKYKTKEIKIIYNNSNNYNAADEQAINSKIPAPKYLTMDFNKCDDWDEMNNIVKNYYADSINDSSVEVKLFSGGGDGEKIFGIQYNSGGPYVLLFKNDICYYANRIGYIPAVPQIIVPENVNDTEIDYINYARPLIVQYLKENKADYVKNIENISITKGGTVDWVDFYATNTTKTFNVENGYTVTATTDWGEEKDTIILKKEKLNPPTPSVTKYTVTFKDYDGKVLKTERVEKGKSATAPTAPTREGYTFKGWDKSFSNVTSNVIITAQYEKQSEVKPIPNIDITPYMFNATYYADMNPDLKTAFGYNETLLRNHYLTYGIKEGRRATPIFDPVYYLNNNGDVKKAFNNNYEQAYYHFINNGVTEGRQSSKFFSVTYYLSQNEDVKKAFSNNRTYAVMHFANCGIAEGRKASKDFDVRTYVNKCSGYVKNTLGQNYIKYYAHAQGANVAENNPINISSYLFDAELYYSLYPDLQQAFGYNPEALKQHYLNCGIKEGRIASYVFNPSYYLNHYGDLKKAFGANGYEAAYHHFINNGIHEGRTGSQYFDVTYYLSQYGDLRNAFDTNYSKALEHFVNWGMNEGRISSKEFNVVAYKKNYADLSKAFNNSWKQYYKHYVLYGKSEKRNCK